MLATDGNAQPQIFAGVLLSCFYYDRTFSPFFFLLKPQLIYRLKTLFRKSISKALTTSVTFSSTLISSFLLQFKNSTWCRGLSIPSCVNEHPFVFSWIELGILATIAYSVLITVTITYRALMTTSFYNSVIRGSTQHS